MTALAEFRPYIIPIAPGIPEFAIDRALIDSAIDFCRQTYVWQEVLDPVLLLAGVTEYEIYPPEGAISAVLEVTTDSEDILERATRESIRNVDRYGRPTFFVHRVPDVLEIGPAPVAPGEAFVRVALEPKAGATQLPEGLYRDWRETIGAGAAARLLLVYGDARQAAVAQGVFDAGLLRANAHATVTRSRGRLRTGTCF